MPRAVHPSGYRRLAGLRDVEIARQILTDGAEAQSRRAYTITDVFAAGCGMAEKMLTGHGVAVIARDFLQCRCGLQRLETV